MSADAATVKKNMLRMILDAEARVPEVAELAGALLKAFGGAEAFAAEYFLQYKAGTVQRSPMAVAKMLEGVVRMINLAGMKKKDSSLENLSDEDLGAVIDEILANRTEKK
jgi:hypothetical protein